MLGPVLQATNGANGKEALEASPGRYALLVAQQDKEVYSFSF